VYICNPSHLAGKGRRVLSLRSAQAVSKTLSQKQNKNKRARDIVQVVESLLGMLEALGSNFSIETKQNKTKSYFQI
jgi:hypothetical protein